MDVISSRTHALPPRLAPEAAMPSGAGQSAGAVPLPKTEGSPGESAWIDPHALRPRPAFARRAGHKGPMASAPIAPPWAGGALADERAETPGNRFPLLCRAFDILAASLALFAVLPMLSIVALAVRLSSPGPVLFVQQRVGRGGRFFPCLKFRSMVCDAQAVLERLLAESEEARSEWARDQKLRRDPRITTVGRFLRKSSLDELPQLFNVLMGHMSIVGPRPIVAAEIDRYGRRFSAYCSVRPGLTGLWQVSGRNAVSYEARVRLDARYAQRKSLPYDLAICLRTVPAVLASRGCY